MIEPQRYQHRLYFHPKAGWTTEPEETLFRLDAQVRTEATIEARNQLYRPDGKGGWTAVTDDKDLSALEKGLVWYGWQTTTHGQPFLALKGVRLIDDELAEGILKDLTIYTEEGERRSESTSASAIFLLSAKDAKIFYARVKELGGKILRGDPLPESATKNLETVEGWAKELEALLQEDHKTIKEAQGQNFSGRAAFERRHEKYDQFISQSKTAYQECLRSIRAASSSGRSIAEKSQAEALLARLNSAYEKCTAYQEERESLEQELARIIARAEGRLIDEDNPGQRILLFRELGRIAQDENLETETTPDGVRIKTAKGWLRLGPGISFES